MPDSIFIDSLELTTHIGVPDAERETAQRLTVSLLLETMPNFSKIGDDLAETVDYFQVCECVKALAKARPRHLIETLAVEIAELLLAKFSLCAVEVELRKFILPDTRFVAVKIRREL